MAQLATHEAAVWWLTVGAGLGLAVLVAAVALSRGERSGRHGGRGVRRGTQAEIRRHRAGGRERTWAGTISHRPNRTATTHVLDLSSSASRRHRAALRYEETGEITQADLEVILGPRPAIGASA